MGAGLALILAMVCMAIAMSLPAQAQVYPTTYSSFTGIQASVTNAASIIPTNAIVQLRSNQGIAILPTLAMTAANISNVVFTFNVSADGTNYSTSAPLTYTMTMNGTNILTGYKLFPPTELNNVRYLKLSTIANGAASGGGGVGCLISKVVYSFSN